MAQPITCDLCQAETAVLMQTNVADGDILAVGPGCLPMFYGGAVMAVMDLPPHTGPASKCQACKQIHAQMTPGITPPGPDAQELGQVLSEMTSDATASPGTGPGDSGDPENQAPYSYEEHTAP